MNQNQFWSWIVDLIFLEDVFNDFARLVAAQVRQFRQVYNESCDFDVMKRTLENEKLLKTNAAWTKRRWIGHEMSQSFRRQSSNVRNVQKSQFGALWAEHLKVFVLTLGQRGSTVFGGQDELGQVRNVRENFRQSFVKRVEHAGTDGADVEQSGEVQPGDVRFY